MEEEEKRQEIINKIRKSKYKVKEVFRLIKSEIDFQSGDLIDSTILDELSLLSKVDEELLDIIYMIQDFEEHIEYEKSIK